MESFILKDSAQVLPFAFFLFVCAPSCMSTSLFVYAFQKRFEFFFFFFYLLQINMFLVFSNHLNVLMSKMIFKK